jgi:predicted DCC family thiol-disulfide oxidoreductase YuxK
MITVFYDGKCGLCRREIEHYKRIAPQGIFEWSDITTNPNSFTSLGFLVSDGLLALHVLDTSQRMHIGIDAFITIWQNIPSWKILGVLMNFPIIRPLAKIIYKHFANWRFKRLGYDKCDL